MPPTPQSSAILDSEASQDQNSQPTAAQDKEATVYSSEKERKDAYARMNKQSEELRWRHRCADILAAFMQKKASRSSSAWNHWLLDVRRKNGIFMLHATCKTNPTTHVVQEMKLQNAAQYGITNWTATIEKKCGTATTLARVNALRM